MNVLNLFALILALPCFSKESQNCNTDNDCSGKYKCHNGACRKCLSCKMLLRSGKDCVFDFEDCGECLKGSEEVLVTGTSVVIKPCRPSRNDTRCRSNENCPNNTYCLEATCVNCFDCQLVSRISPSDGCAKHLEDCGNCMLGFYELPVTIGFNIKPCEKRPVFSSGQPNIESLTFTSNVTLAFLVAILIFWFAVMLFFKSSKKYKSSFSKIFTVGAREMVEPSAPPLFKTFYTSKDSLVHIESELKEVLSCQFVNERRQTAKVFKLPDAPYYDNEGQRLLNESSLDMEEMANSSDTASNADDSSNSSTAFTSRQVNEVVNEVDQSNNLRIEVRFADSANENLENSDETGSSVSHEQNVLEEDSINE